MFRAHPRKSYSTQPGVLSRAGTYKPSRPRLRRIASFDVLWALEVKELSHCASRNRTHDTNQRGTAKAVRKRSSACAGSWETQPFEGDEAV